jgi:hypothetical protein
MRLVNEKSGKLNWANLPKLAAVVVALAACLSMRGMAQHHDQRTFLSAEEASAALVAAAQDNDEKALIHILGPDGKQVVSSGDDVEDAHSRANFVEKYREMHRLVTEPDGTTTLYVGAENWPTPIPLMRRGSGWYFDTDGGKKEILYRRIGENETSTIGVCQELVAAQKEYHNGQHHEYAQKIFSDDGQHNGLYWKAAEGEPQSPIGPLVASAVAEGYVNRRDSSPTPYRGYYFRVLGRQKRTTSSGARSYVVNGKGTEGFAFVAYPAEYRSSGVMTFIVNEDGVVYEKDLGQKTGALAKAMKEYNPNASWREAESGVEEVAGERASR